MGLHRRGDFLHTPFLPLFTPLYPSGYPSAKIDIVAYIIGLYNSQRLHSILGNLPPAVYQRNLAPKKPNVVSEFNRSPHCVASSN
jgi:hypothetical protein